MLLYIGSALTYVLAAILAGTQYHKSGSNPYILAGLIIGLLPVLALFCLICIAHREKELIQILTIIFILLGIYIFNHCCYSNFRWKWSRSKEGQQ